MKMPINCPFCGDALLNEYRNNEYRLLKSCNQKIDHNVLFIDSRANEKLDIVTQIVINITPREQVFWLPSTRTLTLIKSFKNNRPKVCFLPYFLPDFTDYKQLIKKIKLYLTFS